MRQPSGYTVELPGHVKVREETAAALDHLATVTGLSKVHFVRVAVEQYLSSLELVGRHDPVPTPYRKGA